MKQWTALLVACVVVAYQLHYSEAQFSFSIPGSWGNGRKRAAGMMLGDWAAKRDGAEEWAIRRDRPEPCSTFNADFIINMYKLIRFEADRIQECTRKESSMGKQ